MSELQSANGVVEEGSFGDPALHARKDRLARELHTLPEKISDEQLATFEAPEELALEGDEQLALFDVGGRPAQSATVALKVPQIKLSDGTALRKGSVIRGSFLAVVTEVAQCDELDPKTRQVTATAQRHKARVLDLTLT